MPFEIRWIINRKKNRQAAYESVSKPGTGYLFNLRKSTKQGWDLYGCSFCTSISNEKRKQNENCASIPSIRVNGNNFMENPGDLTHICHDDENMDRSWAKIIVNHFYNDTLRSVKETAAKGAARVTAPRSAQVLMERRIRAEDPEIVDLAPPIKKTKRIFNRNVAQYRQHADNPYNIPQALR